MPDQTLAPPARSSDPSPQVSAPGSPGAGIVSNCHTGLPSTALNARIEPGNAFASSLVEKPKISLSSNTTPGTVT